MTTYTLRGWSDGTVAEYPSTLALWFAGNGNRWWELLAHNPALRVHYNGATRIYFIAPWQVGQVVVLPPGWDVRRMQ